MNETVAAIGRGERRDKPRARCPFLHPEPRRARLPTKRPVATNVLFPHRFVRRARGLPCRKKWRNDRSPKKATLHAISPRTGCKRPSVMALIPAMQPLKNWNMTVAKPISNPPAREAHIVKFAQSIVTFCLLCRFCAARNRVRTASASSPWLPRSQCCKKSACLPAEY